MQTYIFATIAFLGLIVSLRLLVSHGLKRPLYCPKEFKHGCDVVKHSPYAWFLGLPTALWGALYYLIFLIFIFLPYILPIESTLQILSNAESVMLALVFYPLFGFVFSLRLLFIQLYKLKALCFWCLIQTVIATILFFYSYLIFTYS